MRAERTPRRRPSSVAPLAAPQRNAPQLAPPTTLAVPRFGHAFADVRVHTAPVVALAPKKKKKKAKPKTMTEAEVRKTIGANNKSSVSEDLLVCLIWKESSFNPKAKSSSSTATGLMQMTKGAVKQVNKSSPKGVHFTHGEMTVPSRNVEAGTRYLQIRIDWAKGDVKKGLEGFGTGSGYADSILACETCFAGKPKTSMDCLGKIHP